MLFTFACSKQSNGSTSETKEPIISATISYESNGETVSEKAWKGTYEYSVDNGDGTMTTAIADSIDPLTVKKEELPIIVTSDQTVVHIQFGTPATSCNVNAWPDTALGNYDERSNAEFIDAVLTLDGFEFTVEPDKFYELNVSGDIWSGVFCFCTSDGEEFLRRTPEEVKELLASYPSEFFEEGVEGIFTSVHGRLISDINMMNDFITSVEAQVPAEISTVLYTTEGDAIYYFVSYDGNDFYWMEDNSRDGFRGNYDTNPDGTYLYLNVSEDVDEEGNIYRTVLLSNDESLTLSKINDNLENNPEYEIPDYVMISFFNVEE